MNIASLAPSTPRAQTNGNPWGFPRLDPTVARAALDGFSAVEKVVDRLIDRSIAVRVQLDADLKSGRFKGDTVRAVDLLTRARDYAIGTVEQKHLPASLQDALDGWRRANKHDERLSVVHRVLYDIEHTMMDVLDDDEGNVREAIASMTSEPGIGSWRAVRGSLDGAISSLYELRGTLHGPQHVIRAAGLYKD